MFKGKKLHKRLMTSLLALVAMTSQVFAQTYTVTVDGQQYNLIQKFAGNNPQYLPLFSNQPWWRDATKANAFATAWGTAFGSSFAYFAYDTSSTPCPTTTGDRLETYLNYYGGVVPNCVQNGIYSNYFTFVVENPTAPPPGPNAVTTYQSLQTADNQTRVAMQQRYAVMTTVLDYDCAKFDKYGICLSFEARGVGFGAMNTGAGVIKASYRLMDKVHAGVFLDYQAGGADPSLPSITNGSVQFGYDNATFGGFVGYNTLMGHTGFEARVTGAYNPGKVNIQRALLVANEAGGGLAGLNASGVYGQVGYGFPIVEGVVITPFLGIRYTDVTRNAYTEQANTLVLYPIGYNNFTQSVVTGLGGGRINGKIIDKLGYEIGGGIEGDYSRSLNAFSGYSYINYVGEFSLPNSDAAWNAIRPFGLAGLTYDITPNQRLTANTTVREQPYSTRSYMSGLVGYQVSF